MTSRSETVMLAALTLDLPAPSHVASGDLPGDDAQLMIQFLKAPNNRVDYEPRHDQQYPAQDKPDGEYRGREVRHESRPKELDDHDRARNEPAENEQQPRQPEKCERLVVSKQREDRVENQEAV